MKANNSLIPRLMMVLYSTKDVNDRGYGSSSVSAEEVYFEYAPIMDGKAGALIPLSDEVSGTLARAMGANATTKVGGYMLPNIIYTSFNGIKQTVAWYTKPEKRRIIYSKAMSKEPNTFIMPWLLWIYKDYDLFVFACDSKPGPNSVLYHAPFPNVYNEGKVCLGSGTKLLAKGTFSFNQVIKNAELAFFGTEFNSQHNIGIKGNVISLHKKLNGTDNPFPTDVLIDTKLSLNGILNVKPDEENQEQSTVVETDNDDEDDDYEEDDEN